MANLGVGSMRRCEAAHTGQTGAFTVSARARECNTGIKAALRDLVRRSWFWLRPEENDDVDQGHTRSRIGNCCHKRPTGICWKLACAVQPKPGLQPLSWGEHVLAARPLSRLQRSRLEARNRSCSGGKAQACLFSMSHCRGRRADRALVRVVSTPSWSTGGASDAHRRDPGR
jgi:hypothetical protein